MNFSIDEFCKKYEYENIKDKYFSNFQIVNTLKHGESVVVVKAKNDKILPFKVYSNLVKYMNSFDIGRVKLIIDASNEYLQIFELDEYIKFFASKKGYFNNACVFLDNDEIILKYTNQDELDKDNEQLDNLKLFLYDIGFKKKISLAIHDPNQEPIEDKQFKRRVSLEEKEHTYTDYKQNYYRRPEEYIPISELHDEIIDIKTSGKILSAESRITKNGRLSFDVLIADDDYNAVRCSLFENRTLTKEKLMDLNVVGQYVMVSGSYQFDPFKKTNILRVVKEEFIPHDDGLIDEAKNKRVELHAHTRFSAMDGVSEPQDIVETAYKYGHSAVAITDHLDVQAFRKVHDKITKIKKNDKDCKLKVLYGCEFNVVDQYLSCVINEKDIPLKDATYVVFDLETTGLSSRYDSIIEFGACKLYKGNIIDRKDFFINPLKKLNKRITRLTGIKDSDLENARTFEECKDEILDFIKDSILVAHNAPFDYGFLNEELRRINAPLINNPVIDTLNLSRMMFKDKKRFRLGNIANEFGVEYNDDDAHRADYDASVLAGIFNLMVKKLSDKGINSLKDLYDYKEEDSFVKAKPYHIVALAKNKKGLKDLYKLVTTSNTETLAVFSKSPSKDGDEEKVNAEPRLFKETLAKHRENLLLGSACFNGEVFEMASTRNKDALAKAISFFDYIEIQPFENYRPLIGRSYSEEDIKQFLKDIIDEAKAQGKLVVATGDVHHITSKEKAIRDIYVNSKGIGGVRHPLYIFDKAERINQNIPDQRFLNTDEMLEAFDWLENEWLAKELVITNTNKVADMCDEIIPFPDGLFAPKIDDAIAKARSCGIDEKPFTGLNEVIDANEYLRRIVFYNAHRIYGDILDPIIENRINDELKCIIDNGYAVIYYVCHLLIKRCNNDGFMVGSRGSVGSSLVAFFADITEVNALVPHYVCPKCHRVEWVEDVDSGYDLPDKKCPDCGSIMKGDGQNIPFATFLGINGDKTPDIDLNFPSDYQAKAHNFTREIFGENNVFRAGTVSDVKEKTAFGYINNYLEEKMIEPYSREKKEALAIACSGTKRTTGKHPGGIVVVPDNMEIEDITPLQYSANDNTETWKTTHLDYHNFEENLLKFDILGHVDPIAMLLLEKISGIKIKDIPMNDPKVISIFNSPEELKIVDDIYNEETGGCGLPEFGTMVARSKLIDTRPTTFADLVKINGLAHGTDVWEHNIADLIKVMGKKLKEVICCRDDVMLDLIKKGMDPKQSFFIMESVRKGKSVKPDDEKEMISHQVPSWYIDSCKKIKYLFPKAHAVAYTMMAYRVAWFKVYYPEYYYVSYFTLRCDAYEIESMVKDSHKILQRLKELQMKKSQRETSKKEEAIIDTLEVCYEMACRGYHITNIDVHKSLATDFLVNPDNHKEIIPPFVVMDGLGAAVANKIVAERNIKPFTSIQDMTDRTSIPKPLVNKLQNMGVFEGMDESNQTTLF